MTTRRQVLTGAVAAALTLRAAPAARAAADDTALLEALHAYQQEVVLAYEAALAGAQVRPGEKAVLTRLRDEAAQEAAALRKAVVAAGGTPAPVPSPAPGHDDQLGYIITTEEAALNGFYVALQVLVSDRHVRGAAAFMAQGGRRLVVVRDLAGPAGSARLRNRGCLAPALASLGFMPNIGPLELAVVLVIALLVLGPKRLPEVGRSLGNGIREFKDSLTGDHHDDDELEPDDVEEVPKALATSAATAPASPADAPQTKPQD